ncbi:MAG TPA: dockerin type I repeat-containing protein, partial [Chthoniobacterales bacterium]
AGRDGGGLRASGTSTRVVTIVSSTIAHNAATSFGGGIVRVSSGNPIFLRNSLVANNTATGGVASDLSGTVTSQGYNLVETTSNFVTGDQTGNIYGVDPNIGALEDNGGVTFTHALLSGSPAIDKGNSGGVTTDQRAFARPFDIASVPNAADGADIGAYEVDRTPPALESASSELTHGDAGAFGVPLLLADSALGIEPRRGVVNNNGRNYTIVLRFNRPITGGTASMTGNGTVGAVTIIGREMIVSLLTIADAQVVTLTAHNVTTQDGGILGSASIQIGFLIGDVNGNGSVNVGDALLAKNRSGQATDPGNFRTDVNRDGIINGGDTLIVRGSSGNFLP